MKPFHLSEDGDCLSEMGVIVLHQRYAGMKLVTRRVKTLTSISKRQFAKIKIERTVFTKKGRKYLPLEDVYADWVTGTLYYPDGRCLSSTQLRML